MELKQLVSLFLISSSFYQSYLSGIKTLGLNSEDEHSTPINRTLVELKQSWEEMDLHARRAINRTLVELKLDYDFMGEDPSYVYQSYLSGIKTLNVTDVDQLVGTYQSYLSGIKTVVQLQ